LPLFDVFLDLGDESVRYRDLGFTEDPGQTQDQELLGVRGDEPTGLQLPGVGVVVLAHPRELASGFRDLGAELAAADVLAVAFQIGLKVGDVQLERLHAVEDIVGETDHLL